VTITNVNTPLTSATVRQDMRTIDSGYTAYMYEPPHRRPAWVANIIIRTYRYTSCTLLIDELLCQKLIDSKRAMKMPAAIHARRRYRTNVLIEYIVAKVLLVPVLIDHNFQSTGGIPLVLIAAER
jgi:hypothetical protein